MEEKGFIKEYKQEYRTILAVLQKVGLDYINSGHLEGNPLQHLEYVLKSVRESCENNICKVCNKREEEKKKGKKKKLKVIK
jgi:deoxyxylulose-5-phosphate synthase